MAGTESDSCPAGPGPAAGDGGQYPETSRSLDSLREMRLTALLGDLIDAQGKAQAAETLGVSYRTLTRFEELRRLTRTLAAVLENHLALGGGTAAVAQRQRVAALEDGLAELAVALRDGLEAARKEGREASEAQAKALGEVRRRLAALESASPATPGGPPASGTPASGAAPVRPPFREYPALVTAEAEPGEELVYGQAATPVIARWREARDAVDGVTDKLARLDAQERLLELEIALIQEHELTLPPARYPWDRTDRRQEA